MNIKKYIPAFAFALPITLYALLAIYNRPYADDFCIMSSRATASAFQVPINVFYTWSGRFASYFAQSLVNGFAPWVGPLTLLAWGAAFAILLTKTLGPRRVPRGICWFAAAFALLTLLAVAPDPYESYYWTTGVLTYSMPLLLITLVLYLLDISPALAALLAFFLAGFSDLGAVLATLFLALLWIVTRKRAVLLSVVTSVIGLALVVMAPGNAIRSANFPTPNLLLSIYYVIKYPFFVLPYGLLPFMPLNLLPVVIGLGCCRFS